MPKPQPTVILYAQMLELFTFCTFLHLVIPEIVKIVVEMKKKCQRATVHVFVNIEKCFVWFWASHFLFVNETPRHTVEAREVCSVFPGGVPLCVLCAALLRSTPAFCVCMGHELLTSILQTLKLPEDR